MSDPIYIMVSLPRTGTTSMAKMAEMCGIRPMHVLKDDFRQAIKKGYGFFSDTPFYIPEFLCGILESLDHEVKFIYSHRDRKEWQESMKLLENWRAWAAGPKLGVINELSYLYIESNSSIPNHYSYIKRISESYNIQMLDYSFNQGWGPFCEFIGKTPPQADVPHLNKNDVKPFEQYRD